MDYYITDTEAEALSQETADYADFVVSLPSVRITEEGSEPIDNTDYLAITLTWDNPSRQRATDNKWCRQVCPASTAVGRTIEALDTGGEWFPIV